MRKFLSRLTSPIFVPLRKLVVWGDNKFGTCDMKLSLEPRYDEETPKQEVQEISELEKKLSCMPKEMPKLMIFNNPNNPTQILKMGWK